MTVDLLEPGKTNAQGGRDCCDEVYYDDGRVTFDAPEKHKGDWGRHRNEEDPSEQKSIKNQ